MALVDGATDQTSRGRTFQGSKDANGRLGVGLTKGDRQQLSPAPNFTK